MLARRPTGQGGASRKYDMLTALGALACAGDKHRQRRVLRFVTLVTARYNWQRDELRSGRAEIARLWSVDERTVKRDLARLKAEGWLVIKHPAARGRVTVYAVDWAVVAIATREAWPRVGPDFEARMSALAGTTTPAAGPDRANVLPFPQPADGAGAGSAASEWDRARAALQGEDPAFHAAWLAAVQRTARHGAVLELQAPSAFHAQYLSTHALQRLLAHVRHADPGVARIVIAAP